MEQTATEWMANELLYLDNEYDMKLIDKNEYQARRKQIIEQAKTMEKEQHKKTWSEGMFCETGDIQAFEQYYNKNFKNAN